MEEENKASTGSAAAPPEAPEEESSSAEKMPPPPSRKEQVSIERAEEQKLRAKYQINKGPPISSSGGSAAAAGGGHSAFLQKRLAKGQKFFDSGDYQMAKQNPKGPRGAAGRLAIPVLAAQPPTGDTIPTPDTVPARKSSIIQPLHDHTRSVHVPSDASAHPVPGQPLPNPAITKLAS